MALLAAAAQTTPPVSLGGWADGVFALVWVNLGFGLRFVCETYPAHLPLFMPWEFSWLAFLTTGFTFWWLVRGTVALPRAERPKIWQYIVFVLGFSITYGVLQTRYLYLAEHMFFMNRLQHLAMHHLGPFLMALGAPWAAIGAGMPRRLLALFQTRPARVAADILQNPVVAPVLFAGLVVFWLIPPIHYKAMLNPHLFWVMNWSMVWDGLLFWCLVLDPRPKPPARLSYGLRAILAVVIMFPQIVVGAMLTFTTHDIYPSYAFCGRVFATLSAIEDQHLGGLVVWVPSAMMSAAALFVVVNWVRLDEKRKNEQATHRKG